MAQKEIIILKKIGVLIVALLEFLLHLGSLIYLIKYMNSLSAQEEYIAILAKSMGVSEETFSNDIKLIKGVCIFMAFLLVIEMIFPTVLLAYGAITGKTESLLMWIGKKLFQIIYIWMSTLYIFIEPRLYKFRESMESGNKALMWIYCIVSFIFLAVVMIYIKEIEQRKSSRKNKNFTAPNLPYTVQAGGLRF